MTKVDIKALFKKGIGLLRDGKVEEALEVFESGLNESVKDTDKGPLLYNIAVCHVRLGRTGLGVEALEKAINYQPWLLEKAQKDNDFMLLHEFKEIMKKNKWLLPSWGIALKIWWWFMWRSYVVITLFSVLVIFISGGLGPKFVAQYVMVLPYMLILIFAIANLYFFKKVLNKNFKNFAVSILDRRNTDEIKGDIE